MKPKSVGFIGGGRVTGIFLNGLSRKKALPENIKVYDPNPATVKMLKEKFPEVICTESPAEAAAQEIVFLAVHPPVIMETLQHIRDTILETTVVISLAPKITLEKMASVLPVKNLARMIPNATSWINKGFNPVTFAPGFGESEKKQVWKLLKKLGKTFETEEAKLEAYAIISAMLPTYFWFQWQELETIAAETGLSSAEAREAIESTLKKAIKTWYKSGLTSEQVMDLIPVKPIGENEKEIRNILNTRLLGLYGKIKP